MRCFESIALFQSIYVLFQEHALFNNFQGFNMKKTLIALASVATVGLAFAQSSNTVYGVVDLGIVNDTTAGTTVASGGFSTSRIGFKGEADLGGGLKGVYKVEAKVDASNPSATTLGGRGASFGVSGNFGTVSFGRQFTPYAISYFNDATEYDGFSPIWYSGMVGGIHGDMVWSSHSVAYTSPSINGVTLRGMYAPAGKDKGTYTGVGADFTLGTITLAAGYESNDNGQGATTTAWNLAAAAQLNGITISGAYNVADNNANKDTGWMVTAAIPLGGGLSAEGGYASEATNYATETTRSGISAVLIKDLNKQLRLYGGFVRGSATGVKDNDTIKLGARFSF